MVFISCPAIPPGAPRSILCEEMGFHVSYEQELSRVDWEISDISQESVKAAGFINSGGISCSGHVSTQMNEGRYVFWLPLLSIDLLCL